MKTDKHYSSFFITNIPSFYKLNLYNEINKRQRVFVLFTGDIVQERTKDFFNGHYNFNYQSMAELSTLHKCIMTLKLIYSIKYDELIISGWDSIPMWIAALFSKKKKNATVIESSAIESVTIGLKGFIKRIYMSRISKVYASGKSQVTLARNMGYTGNHIRITKGVGIFNYVQQPPYVPKTHISKFLYVGRLSEEKNLVRLIKVFNTLPEYTLNIAGFGHQEGYLKSLATKNVHFLGSIDNKKLSKIYQQNDVFILPSSYEPWGLVVEEALNNGLPVILSNRVGCSEELLEEGQNGISFQYDNEKSLIEALRKISNIETYNAMSQYISQMDFRIIEEKQTRCYLHE